MSGTYLFTADDGVVTVDKELFFIGSGYDNVSGGGTTIEAAGAVFDFASGSAGAVLRGFRINGFGNPMLNLQDDDILIEENMITNQYSAGNTVQMVSTQRDTLRQNIFVSPEANSCFGLYIYATVDVHLANNIFAAFNSYPVYTRGNTNLVISNNTFLNGTINPIYVGYGSADSPLIISNILMNNTSGILVVNGSPTISYNAYFNNDDNGETGISPIIGNPIFVNYGQNDNYDVNSYDDDNYDFHLDTGSPCIDAGMPNAEWNDVDPGSGGLRNDVGIYGGPWPIGSNGAPTIPVVNSISVTPATVSPSGTITIEATGRIGE